jgi:serine/threonine protein kinase
MAIPNGTRLGPYEILSAIGAGGMSEVYRARDARLERTVAVKILPDHLSDRAELRERFEREARTIASLNHPHICVLHDIGQQDGIDYLVMEYLEGETLAERLKKGQEDGLACEWGEHQAEYKLSPESPPASWHGKGFHVLRRQSDGSWKFAVLILNQN